MARAPRLRRNAAARRLPRPRLAHLRAPLRRGPSRASAAPADPSDTAVRADPSSVPAVPPLPIPDRSRGHRPCPVPVPIQVPVPVRVPVSGPRPRAPHTPCRGPTAATQRSPGSRPGRPRRRTRHRPGWTAWIPQSCARAQIHVAGVVSGADCRQAFEARSRAATRPIHARWQPRNGPSRGSAARSAAAPTHAPGS